MALTPIGTWLIEDATPQLLARFNSQIESVPGLTEAKANFGETVQNVSDASRNTAKGIHNISDQLDPTLKTHLGEAATSGQDALQHLGEAGRIVANTTQANFLEQLDRLTPYLNELGARKQEFGTMMQELEQFMGENWEQLNLQLDENTGADLQQLREEIGKLTTGMGKASRSTITPSDWVELKSILARIGNIFSVNRISR